ncbi:hypothetical protein [Nocardia asiatica]
MSRYSDWTGDVVLACGCVVEIDYWEGAHGNMPSATGSMETPCPAHARTTVDAARALAERWRNAKTWQQDPDIVSHAYGSLLLDALNGAQNEEKRDG